MLLYLQLPYQMISAFYVIVAFKDEYWPEGLDLTIKRALDWGLLQEFFGSILPHENGSICLSLCVFWMYLEAVREDSKITSI